MIRNFYSLRRSKKLLYRISRLYCRKEKKLDLDAKERMQALLHGLKGAIEQRNPELASRLSSQLIDSTNQLIPRSSSERFFSGAVSLIVLLVVALAIRQTWFEFYTIPTGSMRPTLREGDFLAVSKTEFGINTPMRSGHLYFDPKLVSRGEIVVWNGENMDLPDDHTTYFGFIPGKKQYVKRLIGKPGDSLYFYGGEIYGVGANGRDLLDLREPPYFKEVEHIPFIRFEGRVESAAAPVQGVTPSVILYQMGLPVAKLNVSPLGTITGEMLGKSPPPTYSDLWGFENYGMARLLNKEEMERIYPQAIRDLDNGILYLEINHHPSLQGGRLIRDLQGRVRPSLGYSTSFIPLQKEALESIQKQMTTARFEVRNEKGYRLGGSSSDLYAVPLPGVPDGTYEFDQGIAQEITHLSIAKTLPPNHPLLRYDPALIQTLYNLGVEWISFFKPSINSPLPSRYVYFRNGDLYAMGGPVLMKGAPELTLFSKREYQRQALSTSVKPYAPFEDQGPPLSADGIIDREFIQKSGLSLPEKMYIVLGDNHANSADSREFGFLPEGNLRGAAGFLFWPPGERWGKLPQPHTDVLTLPNIFAWTLAAIATFGSIFFARWCVRRATKKQE